MLNLLLAFVIAFAVAAFSTPTIRRFALRFGFVDSPDAHRKVQSKPIALGGGLVVAISVLISTAFLAGNPSLGVSASRSSWPIALAAAMVIIIGLLDDRYGVRGRQKLFWQIITASLIAATGKPVELVDFMGLNISMGIAGYLFAIAWILGSINAFNLIDGADGLAPSVGFVISCALGIIFVMYGNDSLDALIAFSLAGALLGFLIYNKFPASIYLGDTGSMFIGLVLGALALRCRIKESTAMAAAPLLAIWAILILDSLAAVIRRKMTGRSIYDGDRAHLHHRLLAHGFSSNQTAMLISGLCMITGLAAIISVWLQQPIIGITVSTLVVIGLAVSRVFGHIELKLVGSRMLKAGKNSLNPLRPQLTSTTTTVQLQGNAEVNQLWSAIRDAAERFELRTLRFNLHIARKHEDFFAHWESPKGLNDTAIWNLDRAFVHAGTVCGRVVASGRIQGNRRSASDFAEFLDSLAADFEELASDDTLTTLAPASTPLPTTTSTPSHQ